MAAHDKTIKQRCIVLAIGTLEIGGSEGQLTQLALGLHRRGWDVHVATLLGTGPHAATLRREHIEVYEARFRDPDRPRLVDMLLAPIRLVRYAWWLRRVRPTIVHAFLFLAYVPTAFVAKAIRVPVVITARRSLGHFKAGRRLALALERAANACTDLVVANAGEVAADACAQERLRPEKVVVIPNGVDESFFTVTERAWPSIPRITCVANFIAYKGHADLVDAAALLVRDHVPFVLVLAGDGPCRADIERRVAEMDVPTEFLGTRTDIQAVLANADLVVSASHEEGSSNSLLEAMAAGRAIIATAVGGTPEILGDTGVLVPPHDPESLARELRILLTDDTRRRSLAAEARERARSLFSVERMIDAHEALYTRASA